MAGTRGRQSTPRRGRAAALDIGACVAPAEHAEEWGDARYQAFALLRIAFTVAPIVPTAPSARECSADRR
jgi:hypothetical protein